MRLARYMIGYPLVTIFCWTLPTIQRISDLFSVQPLSFGASQVTVYIEGFLIFLIYCKTSPALKLWDKALRQLLSDLHLVKPQSTPSVSSTSPAPGLTPLNLPPSSNSLNRSLQSSGRVLTNESLSIDFNLSSRPLAFSSSLSREYCYDDDDGDDGYEDEEYEGHRFQNSQQTRQRWIESSFNIPPIIEEE
jgi:hypothetical protein